MKGRKSKIKWTWEAWTLAQKHGPGAPRNYCIAGRILVKAQVWVTAVFIVAAICRLFDNGLIPSRVQPWFGVALFLPMFLILTGFIWIAVISPSGLNAGKFLGFNRHRDFRPRRTALLFINAQDL